MAIKVQTVIICLLATFLALTAASCGKKNLKNEASATSMITDTAADPSLDIHGGGTMGSEGDIRGGGFVSQETIQPVFFDFDGYGLSEDTRTTLQKNAVSLKTHKDWIVLVEGHCDNCGTVEYNLALGQKRAKQVRDYYTRLGVPESSIGAISFGEEKPVCEEEIEECWAKNRRADTKVKPK